MFEEFVLVLTQSFQAEVHNLKSRSAMAYQFSQIKYLQKITIRDATCSLFGFETIIQKLCGHHAQSDWPLFGGNFILRYLSQIVQCKIKYKTKF